MLETHRDVWQGVVVSGQTPNLTRETGGLRRPHPYGIAEGGWTGGTTDLPVRQFQATDLAFLDIRVGSDLASARLCRSTFITGVSPTADTSSPIELHESLLQRTSIDQELAARQRALLARAGGGLTTTQVAQRLNVSEHEVDELRATGRVLAVPDPDGGGWAYPACQFEGPRIVPGLSEVLSDFAVRSPWTRLYVLIGEDSALDRRTPIKALKEGDLDMVREIIRGYGQQGGE
jgi:hypothetical protein